jgi:polyphosphate:AMP phosphotransferase
VFQSAAIEHKLDKATFQRELPTLTTELLRAQEEIARRREFPVIILVTGSDGAGKGEVIQRLYEWLDPHDLRTSAYGRPTEDERLRPRMWRFWRDLPPKGEVGVVFGSWYAMPLVERAEGRLGHGAFERELQRLVRFERMLADEGALILKFLLFLSKDEQAKRLKKLARTPYPSRHILEEWADVRRRGRALPVAEAAVERTSTAAAPWIVVPSADPEYRDLMFGKAILQAMRHRLDTPDGKPPSAPPLVHQLDRRTVLDELDLSRKLDGDAYKERLERAQSRLAALTDSKAFMKKRAVVLAFEGNDAAGKGGAIRRITAALDPRRFRVHPIAAPSDEEKAQPYLWRFWRRLPLIGHTAIFDRTWYGRVLVERVEGLCSEAAWLRAYGEINEFEEQLTDHGTIVVKFWLSISSEEQLRRFQAREKVDFKQYKITPDDWRNRQKWDDYRMAVGDMIDRTGTRQAPWTLVEAEDKHFARVKILETLCERIEASL